MEKPTPKASFAKLSPNKRFRNRRKVDVTYEKHIYDIDVLSAYLLLKEVLKHVEWFSHITKDEYLSRLYFSIKYFTVKSKMNFERIFSDKGFIVVPSNHGFYPSALAIVLLTFDPLRIPLLLSFQRNIYQGEDDFINLVEFSVSKMLINYSRWDNELRIKTVFQWLYLTRGISHSISFPEKLYEYTKSLEDPHDLKTESNLQQPINFDKVFVDLNYKDVLIEKLLDYEIIDDTHKWMGLTTNKTEIVGLIRALIKYGKLIDHDKTTIGRVFSKYFQLNISDRALRSKTYTIDDYLVKYSQILGFVT